MKPLISGIILFLVWMAFSSWFYARYIFPAAPDNQEITAVELPADTLEKPPDIPTLPVLPGDITLYFDFDKAVILNNDALKELISIDKAYMEADSLLALVIIGHTCDIGPESYNMKLGKLRAKAVHELLVQSGINGETLKIVSRGEAEPAVANTSESNRKKNRRAVVHVTN